MDKKKAPKSKAGKSVKTLPAKTLSARTAKTVRGGFTQVEAPVAKKGSIDKKITFPTPW